MGFFSGRSFVLVEPQTTWPPPQWQLLGFARFREFTPQLASAKRTFGFPLEAAMVLKHSAAPASLQLSNQRKRELLQHVEAGLKEQDSWREFNAAYHEDGRKFMRILFPPGTGVLDL